MRLLSFLLLIFFNSCQQPSEVQRDTVDLSGNWQFSLDSGKVGIEKQWYLTDLSDSVKLPGTTDLNRKGDLNKDTTTMHLNRLFKYEGTAWYRKKVTVPQSFRDKHVQLIMERTKSSKVWIDDKLIGESHLLQSPQIFDLSGLLSPGEHTITIRIDNSLKLTPFGNVHIYSDDTQTNWNGIIGKILLEATPQTYISDLQVFPDIDNKKINIKLGIENPSSLKNIGIKLNLIRIDGNKTHKLKTLDVNSPLDSLIQLEYNLGDETQYWDDYHQPLYKLTATINNSGETDSKTVSFGMRKFAVKGTQFTINGRTTFLRGKHDACVFPLTGYPPMDVEGWLRVFKIAKSYGINHYRFHSYCPPDAAFTAADQEGIFLQAELPIWGGLESDSTAAMLLEEGKAMLKNYGNHPSFVMFSPGNEIWSGHDKVERNIDVLKKSDNRVLYTLGSNNNIGYVGPGQNSDFFVAVRTPYAHDTVLTHTRLTHAFADSKDGGILNTQTPSTEVNFNYAVSQIKIPIVSHEIGQYQVYPDYKEIKKYTGVLRAWNLEVFQERLKRSGMLDQNADFQKASGAWAALCYKAEMEAALRTPGLAGFQLLDLQDFPGQGTALVGILDAFMDDKGVVSREEWLQSCNDVVLLLQFPKYCWTNDESFRAKIRVANYSDKVVTPDLNWEIVNTKGEVIKEGTFSNSKIVNGQVHEAGEINFALTSIKSAEKLKVNISLKGRKYSNSYHLWVYPQTQPQKEDKEIAIAYKIDKNVISKLRNGGKVLLYPVSADINNNSIKGLFPPEFWNYGMFKGISEWVKKPVSPGTLGILTDPKHPIFNSFPTDFHTNWQWFSIIKAGNPLILNNTASGYRPIVQVIDNLERNNKLGLIFEFKVGAGKLLVCMSQLNEIMNKPEARQLHTSMIDYMKSASFNPDYSMTEVELLSLFR